MKATMIVIPALVLSFQGAVAGQQTPEEDSANMQGIPSSPHQEQTARDVEGDDFRKLDEDGNGKISREEAQAETMPATRHQEKAVDEEMIGSLDANGDGMTSRQEAAGETRIADTWNQLDEDGDRMLGSNEIDQPDQKLAEIEEAE